MVPSETLHALAPSRTSKPVAAASTKASFRAMETLSRAGRDRATLQQEAEPGAVPRESGPNPLWAITVGMGAFFFGIALIMMFD